MRTSFLLLAVTGCTTYVAPDAQQGEDLMIVGGSDAPAGSYRYQVSIQDRTGFHFCGGSLIADGWVLTAAHCAVGESAQNLRIEAGINRLSEPGQMFDVAEIRIHPGYDANTSNNDVALLRLARSTGSLPPVALMTAASEGSLAATGTPLTVTGWGSLTSGGSSPDRLQQVNVSLVSRSQCQSSYPRENITTGMICASSPGKDSCQGDSGGPAVVANGSELVLTGVVSWGYGCADSRYPGVYARVANYNDWIASQVPGVRFVGGSNPTPNPTPTPTDDHGNDRASATSVTAAGTITVSGALTSGDKDVFKLDLAAPGRVTAVSASSIDTFGTLMNGSASLAQDDDTGPGNNFSVAADVTGNVVYLEVKGYDANAVGNYTVTITAPTASTPPAPTSDADFVLDLSSATVANGALSDRIDAGQRDLYTIEIVGSGAATLRASTTSAIDTFGTLSDEAGHVVATDDDAGAGLNFDLSGGVVPGLYLLEVRGYSASTTGAYDLAIQASR